MTEPSPEETQIWECDPLLIEDYEGNVVYKGRCQVEFTPHNNFEDTGHITTVDVNVNGWLPAMEVDGKLFQMPVSAPGIYAGRREGRTLWGHDDAGQEYFWYVNGDADQFVLDQLFPRS